MQPIFLILLVASFAGGASSSYAADSSEAATVALITRMEQDRVQAGVRKDVDAVAAATADDYMHIDLDGVVRDKAAAMKRIASSTIQLESNTLDEMKIRVYGGAVVVTGRSTPKGTINGEAFPQIRYSRTYVNRSGTWKVVLFQMTRVAGH
jgi:ketosteroid isomerase-like protein